MVKDKKEDDAKESKDQAAIEALAQPDEREVSKDTGEETSEIRNIGGAMYRVVKTDSGTTFVPL